MEVTRKRPYLQSLRFAAGLSQTQFAKTLGISQQYLSQIERNQAPCPDQLLRMIAEQLQVDYQHLRSNMLTAVRD